MNSMVEYSPLLSRYKYPLGAVKVNEPIDFRLDLAVPLNLGEVFLVLQKDEETPVWYKLDRGEAGPEGLTEFTTRLFVTSRGLYFYHFIVIAQEDRHYIGCASDLSATLGNGGVWQLTVYEESGKAPAWQNGGVYYQIMPDRFFIGNERLTTKKTAVYRDDWGGIPQYLPDAAGKILNNDFFGGNLKGITKKLAYLKSLNVTCLYLNPIFEARSNHKYDTGSYFRIDPDFGTLDDLKELIKKAAKKNIKIMLDGVFSHTGDDSIYFNKYGTYNSVGAYQSKNSPYASWYSFNEFPDDYVCWWGIKTLPNTVEENAEFSEFINGEDGVIRTYTKLGIGGWRLDVADELPDGFLDRAAQAAKAENSEVMLLGEVWEDASNKVSYSRRRRYLQGGQLDSVTNYPFKEEIIKFVKNGNAKSLADTAFKLINNYPKSAVDSLMNPLGTHDTVRILTELGDSGDIKTRSQRAAATLVNREAAIEKLKLATVLQFTLPGCPCVYYGDEAGVEGFEDPFNRRCYPWKNEEKKLLRWYRRLGKIRVQNKHVYAEGGFKLIVCRLGVFAFERLGESETIITIVNNGVNPYKFDDGKVYTDLLTNKPFNGTVSPYSAVILKESEKIIKA